eukprot:gb/GECG01006767.1/.p1 GENE.gb/GECG01006767.1/~~gb/GECG01006767.1/.p1  ORF type:complete len:244 (+),score=39.80 gb/GECG01006767.1/:1-732(+)
MSPLPLFKLGSLLVKTVAKPVAKQIKEYAQEHPRFRGLCIRLGRAIHYTTTHLEVNLRQGRIIKLKELPETKAISTGADFLGESFVFSVGAVMVFVEYRRQRKEKAVEAEEKARKAETEHKIISMRFEAIEQELHQLARHVAAIEYGMRNQGYSIPLPPSENGDAVGKKTETTQEEGQSELVDKYDKMLQEQSSRISSMRERLTAILRTPAKIFNKPLDGKDAGPTVEAVSRESAPREEDENR